MKAGLELWAVVEGKKALPVSVSVCVSVCVLNGACSADSDARCFSLDGTAEGSSPVA